MRGSAYVPIMFDSDEWDVQPEPSDEPKAAESIPYEYGVNEMQRCAIRRHTPYSINMLCMDWSVRKKTIKEQWLLPWHRDWPKSCDHLPAVWTDQPDHWMNVAPDLARCEFLSESHHSQEEAGFSEKRPFLYLSGL